MYNVTGTFIVENVVVNVVDTTEIIPNDSSAINSIILLLNLGGLINSTSATADDGSTLMTTRSTGLFGSSNPAQISAVFDNGIAFAFDSFIGSVDSINGNGHINVPSYARVQPTSSGGLYFSFLNTGADVRDGTVNIHEYTNGTIIELKSSMYRGFVILCSGLIYTVSLTNDLNLGYFLANSTQYQHGVSSIKGKMLVITPKIFTLKGHITDYYSELAEGIDIRVFNKHNNLLMGQTTSTSTGEYEIGIIGMQGDECFMILFSPTNSEFQSKVIDTITLT